MASLDNHYKSYIAYNMDRLTCVNKWAMPIKMGVVGWSDIQISCNNHCCVKFGQNVHLLCYATALFLVVVHITNVTVLGHVNLIISQA